MRLADGLRLSSGRVAAFVGAGGKTSAIARIAGELRRELPVLFTTSTKLGRDQLGFAGLHRQAASPDDLVTLADDLTRARVVALTGPLSPTEPKWLSPAPLTLELACQIASAVGGVALVEADGGRGASLKAPADHEPVIPPFADLVVPVAALDALGGRLAPPLVHRPERVARLLAKRAGDAIGAEDLVRVLTDPHGGLKGVPAGVEVRILLNKADTIADLETAEAISEDILRERRVRAVVAGQARSDTSECRLFGRVAGVILAAGGSRRLGRPKQLLAWRGRPLVWHALQAARLGGLDPLVVVIGAEAEALRAALAGEAVSLIENPAWQQGQSTSLRAGLLAVADGVEAAVFLLSDTPLVDAELVAEIRRTHARTRAAIVAPRVLERWANPVLFDRRTFPALHQITGDHGGRALFGRYPITGVPWDARILADVDTLEDLTRLQAEG